MKRSVLIWSLLSLSPIAMIGCGDDAAPGPQSQAGQTATQTISAADGGTFDALGVTLEIAPGALGADTDISLAIESSDDAPSSDSVVGDVYVFGPSGLTFATPATMTLPFDADAVPSGATAQISVLDGNAWVALDGSTVSGDTISAQATHFSRFAVTFVGATQTGGGCDALEFTPCGGDLTGTWTFAASCATLAEPPVVDECPTAEVVFDVEFTGTVTFGADTAFSSSSVIDVIIEKTYPKTCLPSGMTCADIGPGVVDTGDSCVQTQTNQETNDDAGTWTSAGTTVTITRPDDTPETQEYCVSGDSASVKVVDPDTGDIIIYVLER